MYLAIELQSLYYVTAALKRNSELSKLTDCRISRPAVNKTGQVVYRLGLPETLKVHNVL